MVVNVKIRIYAVRTRERQTLSRLTALNGVTVSPGRGASSIRVTGGMVGASYLDGGCCHQSL